MGMNLQLSYPGRAPFIEQEGNVVTGSDEPPHAAGVAQLENMPAVREALKACSTQIAEKMDAAMKEEAEKIMNRPDNKVTLPSPRKPVVSNLKQRLLMGRPVVKFTKGSFKSFVFEDGEFKRVKP